MTVFKAAVVEKGLFSKTEYQCVCHIPKRVQAKICSKERADNGEEGWRMRVKGEKR